MSITVGQGTEGEDEVMAAINTTPLVDVMLVLLIIFLITIPAVIAYNRFSHDIDRLASRYESFMEELQNILQRQAHLPHGDATTTVAQRPR